MRLIIPAIHIDAKIQNVGITPEGVMEVPKNIAYVGWFDLGPRPGELGSAVIAGHLNGKNGESGIFANLSKLQKGDKLYIAESDGTLISFLVKERLSYDPGYAENVFSKNDTAHLNLITCEGIWDNVKKSYSKRLVIFSDIVRNAN
ncbi:MAG TPA: class F sortase [Candidatus Saccharimonadales bacterium]|nr:class F sortase [Candidatus Saccharimonadales bacterium]